MERFQFINEADLTSGKVTSYRARKTIRTHVMRQHWATAGGRDPESMLNTSKRPRETTKLSPAKSIDGQKELQSDMASSTETEVGDVSDGSRSNEESRIQPSRLEAIGKLSRHLNRVTDAFVYAGSSIDRKSYRFFNHYSSEFHVGLCSHIQPIPVSKTSVCCAAAVQEDSRALLHAICYTGAIHEAAVREASSDPRRVVEEAGFVSITQQHAIRHKATALNQLNKRLVQNPKSITEATILCVTLLIVIEAIFSDTDALSAHSKGLSQLIEIFGGEEVLPPAISTIVHLADIKAAAVRQTQPIYPLQPYIRHRFDCIAAKNNTYTDDTLYRLGSRFFSSPLSSYISPGLQRCLSYAHHLVQLSEQHKVNGRDLSTYGIDDFTGLEHRLLSLPYEASLNELSECLRLALLLYSNLALWKTLLYFGWIPILASELKTALLALGWQSQSHGPEVHQLLLWILLIGGQATRYADAVEAAWWTSKLLFTIKSLQLTEWKGAVDVLQGFFYVATVSEQPWKEVWKAAILFGGGSMSEVPQSTKHPCTYLH